MRSGIETCSVGKINKFDGSNKPSESKEFDFVSTPSPVKETYIDENGRTTKYLKIQAFDYGT